jgi:hypothetical protein
LHSSLNLLARFATALVPLAAINLPPTYRRHADGKGDDRRAAL